MHLHDTTACMQHLNQWSYHVDVTHCWFLTPVLVPGFQNTTFYCKSRDKLLLFTAPPPPTSSPSCTPHLPSFYPSNKELPFCRKNKDQWIPWYPLLTLLSYPLFIPPQNTLIELKQNLIYDYFET